MLFNNILNGVILTERDEHLRHGEVQIPGGITNFSCLDL